MLVIAMSNPPETEDSLASTFWTLMQLSICVNQDPKCPLQIFNFVPIHIFPQKDKDV